jgi:hypothetical protein
MFALPLIGAAARIVCQAFLRCDGGAQLSKHMSDVVPCKIAHLETAINARRSPAFVC